MNILGKKLRELREEQGLLLRQIAAILEVDTALMSKLERGERRAQREHIKQLASVLKVQENELVILWLADKIKDVVRNEPLGLEALKLVEQDIIQE
ncbi:helix-turn-helix domain-containing protein [Saccharicrinis fermentans]|uniref:Putative transcriptional regulator n=1 Tax=Saccharicrinis fermentans DSM 9555 = JCM 21142 TaxID=869213 RepID=W7Y395_9BACT|nr:helix-turn-helix transcriptional regulator [Saccharicrinis fermentans]GAF05320.1 putative transcriptional regulator [Saccharicrinis fermentans DSM 9555 = JCM 21142]